MHMKRASPKPQSNSASLSYFSGVLIWKKGGLPASAAQIPVIIDEVDCEADVWLSRPAQSSGGTTNQWR